MDNLGERTELILGENGVSRHFLDKGGERFFFIFVMAVAAMAITNSSSLHPIGYDLRIKWRFYTRSGIISVYSLIQRRIAKYL